MRQSHKIKYTEGKEIIPTKLLCVQQTLCELIVLIDLFKQFCMV